MEEFSMEELPYFIRGEIFSYFSLKMMIVLECTSRSWKQSMPYFICKKFVLTPACRLRKPICTETACFCSDKIRSVFTRVSSFVRTIKLDYNLLNDDIDDDIDNGDDNHLTYCKLFCEKVLQIALEFGCPRLQSLDFFASDICFGEGDFAQYDVDIDLLALLTNNQLKSLYLSMETTQLKSLSLNHAIWQQISNSLESFKIGLSPSNMSLVFPFHAANLKVIEFSLPQKFVINSSDWLACASLCPNVESIDILANDNNQPIIDCCNFFVSTCLKLQKLYLTPEWDQIFDWNRCLKPVCENCSQLDLLLIRSGFIGDFTPLRKLHSLKKLDFYDVEITNVAIVTIFEHCQQIETFYYVMGNNFLLVENEMVEIDNNFSIISILNCLKDINIGYYGVYRLPESSWPTKLQTIVFENIALSSTQLRALVDCCGESLQKFEFDYIHKMNYSDIEFVYSLHAFDWDAAAYLFEKAKLLSIVFIKLEVPGSLSIPPIPANVTGCIGRLVNLRKFTTNSSITIDAIESLFLARCQQIYEAAPLANMLPLTLKLDSAKNLFYSDIRNMHLFYNQFTNNNDFEKDYRNSLTLNDEYFVKMYRLAEMAIKSLVTFQLQAKPALSKL